MKVTIDSDFLVPRFFPGNDSRMSIFVERLDRTTAIINPSSGDFIECVLIGMGASSNSPPREQVILVNHGMGRTLDDKSVEQWREWAVEKNVAVVLHNYPGYGTTPGPVRVGRIIDDQKVLMRMLLRYHKPAEIVVLGNSIGCGPTIAMANEFELGMVILVSPYMSCCSLRGSLGWRSPVFRCFRGSRFDPFNCRKLVNLDRLKQQRILIICGEADTVIDTVNSWEIQELIGDNVKVCALPEVNHRTARLSGDYLIELFLRRQDDKLDEAIAKAMSAEGAAAANMSMGGDAMPASGEGAFYSE